MILSLTALPPWSLPVKGALLFTMKGEETSRRHSVPLCPMNTLIGWHLARLGTGLPLCFSLWAATGLLTRGFCIVPLTWSVSDHKPQLSRSRIQSSGKRKSEAMPLPCPALPWVAPQDSGTSWPCLAASGRGVSLLKWSLSNCFSDCVSCSEEKTEGLRSTWVAGGPLCVWSWAIPLTYCLILVLGRQDPSGPPLGPASTQECLLQDQHSRMCHVPRGRRGRVRCLQISLFSDGHSNRCSS